MLLVLEASLRLAGHGYETGFFKIITIGNQNYYVQNDDFALRFFPRETSRSPNTLRMPVHKPPGTVRIFIFGESAARMTRRAQVEQGVNHSVLLPAVEPGTKWFFTAGTARVPLATNSFIVPGKALREGAPSNAIAVTATARKAEAVSKAPPTRETWGDLPSLPDHFARHGRDFKAKNADDYARMAWEFRQRAKAGGLLIKVDSEGVARIYDPKSGAFGAYNRNGTTKTFFKPNSRDYFDRQPG